MSSTPLSGQVVLSTVSEHDGLPALGWVYMYCYCNHIYSMILQLGLSEHFPSLWLDSRISLVDVFSYINVNVHNAKVYGVLEPESSQFWTFDLIKECLP